MSGSSNFDSFRNGDRIVSALWGVAARTCSILLAAFLSNYRLVSVQVVHPCSSIDTTAAWKKPCFILSFRSDSLSIVVDVLFG